MNIRTQLNVVAASVLVCGMYACSGGGGGIGGNSAASGVPTAPASAGPSKPNVTINGNPVTISEFPLPSGNVGPVAMTATPDGNAWFLSQLGVNSITPAGSVTTYNPQFPQLLPIADNTVDIATGPDKALWFTTSCAPELGCDNGLALNIARITTTGSMTFGPDVSFTMHQEGVQTRLVSGPGGNIWMIGERNGGIDQQGSAYLSITPSMSIALNQDLPRVCPNAPFPPNEFSYYGRGIARGSDGALYVTGFQGADGFSDNPDCPQSEVFRIDAAGKVSNTYVIPVPSNGEQDPIASGPDGNLWLVPSADPTIILRMTKSGSFTQFRVPTPNPYIERIIAGDDGAMWFAEWNAGKVGRITMDGKITEYATPTAGSHPYDLASLPGDCPTGHGRIWFTESATNKVGRVDF